MSPRLPSASTISPAVRAYWQTLSNDFIPSAPSASKNASWGLTPTAYGATASITPPQNRVQASADSARPRAASPASSSGSSSGTGSRPTSNWLRLRSTSSASLSPKARTFVPCDAASSSCTMASESTAGFGNERGPPTGGPLKTSATRASYPPLAPLLTACLSWLPAENFGTVVAGISTRWEGFLGLTPCRAARRWVVNLPNPVKDTSPPDRRVSVIESRKASTASAASRFEILALSATFSTNSCFVTSASLWNVVSQADPNSQALSAQPCGFAAVFCAGSKSPARNSGTRRTPRRARASAPPSSRSSTQTAIRHSRPASRTSSTRHTRSPGSNTPSSRFAVPYSFADDRTITNGILEESDAAAASATAPSSGPASRTASGSCSDTSAARCSPNAANTSGWVSKRYLSR